MDKIYIDTLSSDDLLKVWENNTKIRDEVFENLCFDASNMIDNEVLYYFRHYNRENGREKWTIDIHESSQCFYITVNDNNIPDFLDDIKRYSRDIGTLTDYTALIDRLSERSEKYVDCINGYEDISAKKWDQFEKWMNEGIRKLCEALADNIKDIEYQAYDEDYQISYFTDEIFLQNTTYYIKPGSYIAYEDITRCMK